jgi:hypothetical protein
MKAGYQGGQKIGLAPRSMLWLIAYKSSKRTQLLEKLGKCILSFRISMVLVCHCHLSRVHVYARVRSLPSLCARISKCTHKLTHICKGIAHVRDDMRVKVPQWCSAAPKGGCLVSSEMGKIQDGSVIARTTST